MSELYGPKFVVIGGGTGNFTVLSGLKHRLQDQLTAIVGMVDDGGSTGELRDQFATLPPGDIRQCLIALSNVSPDIKDLFGYHRFDHGSGQTPSDFEGHNLTNIILTAAQQRYGGDFNKAIAVISDLLLVKGKVLPATLDDRRLKITTIDGQVLTGETSIEHTNIKSLAGCSISFNKTPTTLNEAARTAILAADMVIIAPGDLYTSIAPALAVDGMREVLEHAKIVVQVSNLMNRDRLTVGFTVVDAANEVQRIVGSPILDYVLFNNQTPSEELLRRYASKEGEYPVEYVALQSKGLSYKTVGRDLLSDLEIVLDPADAIAESRSLIRHDQQKVADALMGIYYGHETYSS
jgi:uncharacterized cofD-like protein